MKSSARSLIGIAVGVLVLLIGFLLLLHPDFWTVTYPNGVVAAPYSSDFETLARLLMYSGAVLSVVSAALWIYGPHQPPDQAL